MRLLGERRGEPMGFWAFVLNLLRIIGELPDRDRGKVVSLLLSGIFVVVIGGGVLYGFLKTYGAA